MKFDYKKLGNLIEISETKNKDLTVTKLVGMNIHKEFIPSVANTIGTNLARYKLINENQFACNLMHVGRDKSVVISLFTSKKPTIISPAYKVFEIKNKEMILPKFLMMYFRRSEFDRLGWFYTDSSIRGSLDWAKFCDIKIPIPTLEIQEKIVKIYEFLNYRIKLKERINKNLEEQLSLIYDNHCVKCSAYDEEALIKTNWEKTHKGWKNIDFGNIIQIESGDRPDEKSEIKTSEFNIPIFGASKIMGYTKEFSYNEDILVIGRVGTHGVIQRVNYPCFPSDNTLIIKSNYYGFVYQLLKRIDYDSLNTGSTQPLITQKSLKTVNIVLPDENTLFEFENISKVFFDKIYINQKEITSLTRLRDILLPKLMSGEIDVSKINYDLE